MRRTSLPMLAVAALGLVGCHERKDPPTLRRTVPVEVGLDLLFVIDNSGSMQAEQEALAAAFPELLGVLGRLGGRLPDLHVGVISSNAGAAGQAGVPGCSNPGDDGNLLSGPPGNTCAAQFGLQGSFISDVAQVDGSHLTNYQEGQIAPLFACMAALGTGGCGFEMHLESLYRALQPEKNAGFLRDQAYLGVVILADEDDCSTEVGALFGDPTAGLTSALGPRTSFRCHEFGVTCASDPTPRTFGPRTGCRPREDSPYLYRVGRYVDFLRGLKADPRRVVVAGLVGDFDPVSGALSIGPDPAIPMDPPYPAVQRSCHTSDPLDPNDGASPAVRLQAFLRAFPERNASSSVCAQDLRAGLAQIGERLAAAVGHLCMDQPLADGSAGLDGLQPACTVAELVGANRQIVPQCTEPVQSGAACQPGDAGTPCWCLHPDAVLCPAEATNPGQLTLDVARGSVAPGPGAALDVQCLLAGP